MSIEEIIKNLETLANAEKEGDSYFTALYGSDIIETAKGAFTLLRTHPEAKPNGWISVEERLPEPMVDVLALHRDDVTGEPDICIEWVDREKEWVFNHRGPVTHWMPLPEPPAPPKPKGKQP